MSAIVKTTPFQELSQYAKAFADSGLFNDTRQAAQAIVKIQAGNEMGFPPFISMAGIHIISGKVAIGANLIAAAVARSPRYKFRVLKHTTQECHIAFFLDGEQVGVSEFSIKDAEAAGLLGNPSWRKYARNMLYARAMSNGQKWYAPDVFNGATVYTPEEMGAEVDEEGAPVKVANTAATTPAAQQEAQPEQTDSREQVEGEPMEQPKAEPAGSVPTVQEWVSGAPNTKGTVTGVPVHVTKGKSGTTGGKPWQLFTIILEDGRGFSTFSESLADQTLDGHGETLTFTGKYGTKGGFTAETVELAKVPVGGSPVIREEDIPF